MAIGRNEKCPCGSGKKYKHCCLQRDLEAAKNKETLKSAEGGDAPFEENPSPKFATWKIFAAGTAVLGVIGLIISFLLDMPRLGGSVFGCGMLILVFYCAFRNMPTVRKRPGDAGNIDFGNRV